MLDFWINNIVKLKTAHYSWMSLNVPKMLIATCLVYIFIETL